MRIFALPILAIAMPAFAVLPTPNDTAVSYGTTQTSVALTPITTPQPQTGQLVSEQVDLVVNVFLVQTDELGQERLTPVTHGVSVSAGDVLEYQGLFTNTGNERIRHMQATLTIADGLELIGGVVPQFAHASHDGQKFVRMPIRANINGQVQELPLSYYKALRWTVEDIGLGATAVVKYRAKVK